MTPKTRSALARYGLAVILTAAVVVIRTVFIPGWSRDHPYLLFYPAIILSGWNGGFGPGLVATALAAASLTYLWLPPLYSMRIASEQDVVALLLFVAIGFAVSMLNEALFRANVRAAEQAKALEREAAMRRTAESEATRLVSLTAELQRRDESSRTSFEADPVGRLRFRRGEGVAECNRALARILGHEARAPLIGLDPRRLFVDPADFDSLMQTMARGVIVSHSPAQWRGRDGSVVSVLLGARETADGLVDVVVVDVSRRVEP